MPRFEGKLDLQAYLITVLEFSRPILLGVGSVATGLRSSAVANVLLYAQATPGLPCYGISDPGGPCCLL